MSLSPIEKLELLQKRRRDLAQEIAELDEQIHPLERLLYHTSDAYRNTVPGPAPRYDATN